MQHTAQRTSAARVARLRKVITVISHAADRWQGYDEAYRRKLITKFKSQFGQKRPRAADREIEHLFNLPMALVAEICATEHASKHSRRRDYDKLWKSTFELIYNLDVVTYEELLEAIYAMPPRQGERHQEAARLSLQ